MDATIAKLLEILQHLVRDILSYLIPGLCLFTYLVYLDKILNEGNYYVQLLNSNYIEVLVVSSCYVIGQLVMAAMLLLVEKTGLEKFITRKLKLDFNIKTSDEIDVFIKNRDAYDYFIERLNQLYYLRWNLSGVAFIIFLSHLIITISHFSIKDFIITSLFLLLSILLLILHYQTGKEYNDRVDYLKAKDYHNQYYSNDVDNEKE